MPSILLNIKNNVATLTLNRPEKFNSFNREMAYLLQQYLHECAANPAVNCIVLTGAGKAYSAGQDIEELTGENAIGIDEILSLHYNPIITQIRELGKVVIAAVNGVAAGAGANIALCCDIVVAASSASFIQAFSKIGLIPDSGGTYFLPRLIGFQKASALMITGDKVTADEAEKMGMLFKVYSDDSFEAELTTLAERVAKMPILGLAFTKAALNQSHSNTLPEQLALEDKIQRQAASTEDYQEGISAFLAKRKPVFMGK